MCLAVGLRGLSLVGAELAGELVHAHRAEDALAEEALDDGQQDVFADGEPLAVPVDLIGSDLAVGSTVVAGHVDVLLAGPAVHREGLVSGGAADHAGEDEVFEPWRPLLRGREEKRSWAVANSSSEISGRCSTSETIHSS